MKVKNKKIIFTGGGTAGHVVPNIALITKCQKENWSVIYIGTKHGIERNIIEDLGIKYFAISTGKLRRYFSWYNFLAPLQIFIGVFQALILCKKIQPDIIFSKGGFVSFPVVFAAWLCRIPVIIHESDLTPGLANRLSFPFAKKICVSLDASRRFIKSFCEKKDKLQDRVLVTGTPIREELFFSDAKKGREICGFSQDKKIILVQGGGLGSDAINKMIRDLLPALTNDFQIVHSCGKGKVDLQMNHTFGYLQFEYISSQLAPILACADLVISRAGANSIFELIALKKPHILLPLSQKASRGDQLMNAKYWEKKGLSRVIYPDDLAAESLLSEIHWLNDNLDVMRSRLENYCLPNSAQIIYNLFLDVVDTVAY